MWQFSNCRKLSSVAYIFYFIVHESQRMGDERFKDLKSELKHAKINRTIFFTHVNGHASKSAITGLGERITSLGERWKMMDNLWYINLISQIEIIYSLNL